MNPLAACCALIIAHPGHELRVHGWLSQMHPQVSVLTDGSGHTDRGRIASTRRVLDRSQAVAGSIFGRFPDRAAYQLLLERDLATAQEVVAEIAHDLLQAEVECVVSDALEGFNPIHDLCFVMAQAASRLASRRSNRPLAHFDFPLEAAPTALASPDDETTRIDLDEAAWERKMAAVSAYGILRDEAERAFSQHGRTSFRTELLRRVPEVEDLTLLVTEPTHYETFGQRRVEEGIYDRVLRFRDHFLPLATDLMRWSHTA